MYSPARVIPNPPAGEIYVLRESSCATGVLSWLAEAVSYWSLCSVCWPDPFSRAWRTLEGCLWQLEACDWHVWPTVVRRCCEVALYSGSPGGLAASAHAHYDCPVLILASMVWLKSASLGYKPSQTSPVKIQKNLHEFCSVSWLYSKTRSKERIPKLHMRWADHSLRNATTAQTKHRGHSAGPRTGAHQACSFRFSSCSDPVKIAEDSWCHTKVMMMETPDHRCVINGGDTLVLLCQ